ncbi:hypothetical protein VNO80_00102 [Phaseolus coccineus]|uniref:Uncharacterized protein n=1 Tax=Phaseolus coccineus TaxID=3886 RepID=A0AAN9RR39_PHACN
MEHIGRSRNEVDEAYPFSWICNINYYEYDEREFEDDDDTEHWRKPRYSRRRGRRRSHSRARAARMLEVLEKSINERAKAEATDALQKNFQHSRSTDYGIINTSSNHHFPNKKNPIHYAPFTGK